MAGEVTRVAAVVPSLGASREAAAALAALRRELAPFGGALVWVHQGGSPAPALDGPREQRLDLPRPAGFARAANAGIAAAAGSALVALVNDDCVVEPGWLAALVAAFDEEERLGSAQGVVLDFVRPALADGCGLAWNRWLQAVQIGHGAPAPDSAAPARAVLGVSATAALYRRAALERVASGGAVFDTRLDSYYEDVDLALRMAADGWTARLVPAARARHLGSATGARRPLARHARIHGNRWAVVARWQGRRLPLVLPRLALRDLADLARAIGRLDLARAGGVVAGWGRAATLVPRFARFGPPRPALDAPRRSTEDRA